MSKDARDTLNRNEPVRVFLDIAGVPQPLGTLWFHYRGGRESASFQYDPAWLSGPVKFPIDPDLPLFPGVYHSSSLFGVFSDAAPDRWGRMLMRRGVASGDSLSMSDYLLRVDDGLRMGALRFRVGNGPFLAADSSVRVPPMTELPRLIAAAQRLDAGNDDKWIEDIRLLLRPGASLGGAHPKAAVLDKDGTLWIAKFPGTHAEDQYRPHWEYLVIHLASQTGIRVPDHRLLHLSGRTTVFLTRRFDRNAQGHRKHYASAMTLLGAQDGETRSYEEIAEALRELGAPPEDVRELWQRVAFSVLVSNVDDHLRNHGVLWSPSAENTIGFRLSPAFDINPAQPGQDRTVHGTALRVGGSTRMDFPSVWMAAGDFLWEEPKAREAVQGMVQVVSTWAEEAKKVHIPRAEMECRRGAFEHEDLAVAREIGKKIFHVAAHKTPAKAITGSLAIPEQATTRRCEMPTVLMERNNLADAFVPVSEESRKALAEARREVGEDEWKKGFSEEKRETVRNVLKEQGVRYETTLKGELQGVELAETKVNGEPRKKLRVALQKGEDRILLSADLDSEFAQRLAAKLDTLSKNPQKGEIRIGAFASPKERDGRDFVDHVATLKGPDGKEIPAEPGLFERAQELAKQAQQPMIDAGMTDKKILNQIAASARARYFEEVVRGISRNLKEQGIEMGSGQQSGKSAPRLEAHVQEPDETWRSVGLWADKDGKLAGSVAVQRPDGEKERLPVSFQEKISQNGVPMLQAVGERDDGSRVFVSLMPHETKDGQKFISASFAEKAPGQELVRIEGRGGGLKPNQAALEQGVRNRTVQAVKEKLGVNVLENARSQDRGKEGKEGMELGR